MNEKIQQFYEVISADDALQAELVAVTEGVDIEGVSEEEARTAVAEAVAAFAAEHDFDLTAEDILAADTEVPEGELSEAELEAVAGGAKCGCVAVGAVKGCFCFFYGESKGLSTTETEGKVGDGTCGIVGGAADKLL